MKEDKFIKINLYIFFIFSVVWLILFLFSGMRFNFSELFYSRLKCFLVIFTIAYIVYIVVVSIACAVEEYIKRRKYIAQSEYINMLIAEIDQYKETAF